MTWYEFLLFVHVAGAIIWLNRRGRDPGRRGRVLRQSGALGGGVAPQWPQPQPPPQQPPPLAEPKLGFDDAPWTANAENCLSTLPAPQLGHVTTWSSERTSSSKCSSHFMHAYS